MRLISIVLALLLIPLLAASAGAIYVEGQAPPADDGQMHILAAETGVGDAPVPTLYDDGTAQPYPIDGDNVLVPGSDPNLVYALDEQEAVPIYTTAPVIGQIPGLTGKIPTAFTVPTIGTVPQLAGSLGSISGLKELLVPSNIGSIDLGTMGLGGFKVSAPCIFV